MSAFDEVTAVRPLGDGRFAAHVAGGWGGPNGPNGGYVAAIVVRAMQAAVPEDRYPRTITLHYMRVPFQERDAVVEVDVQRRGAGMTTLSARLVQDGDRASVVALGAFATEYPSPVEFTEPAPSAPPRGSLEPVPVRDSRYALHKHLTLHHVFGPPPTGRTSESVAGGWLSLAEPEPLAPHVLAQYSDSWWPAIFGRAVLHVPTVELTLHFRGRPAPGEDGAVLARFATRTATEGFFEEDGLLWGADGRLLLQSRQLGLLRAGVV